HDRKLGTLGSCYLLRFGLRLYGCNPRPEPAYGAYRDAIAVRGVIVEPVCNPDIRRGNDLSVRRKVQAEVWLEHADDDWGWCLRADNLDRASKRGWISAKPPLEVLIAQDRVHRQLWWRRPLLLCVRRRSGRIRNPIIIIEISAVGDAATEQSEGVSR